MTINLVAQITGGQLAAQSLVENTVVGAVAGNVTVTGIAVADTLISVLGFTLNEAAPNTINVLDLTSEFTITAADTINNAAGTSSANGILFVSYFQAA